MSRVGPDPRSGEADVDGSDGGRPEGTPPSDDGAGALAAAGYLIGSVGLVTTSPVAHPASFWAFGLAAALGALLGSAQGSGE